jgi:hypothetical protein
LALAALALKAPRACYSGKTRRLALYREAVAEGLLSMLSRNHSRTLCLFILENLLFCLCGIVAVHIRFGPEARDVLIGERGLLKVLLLAFIAQGSFYLFDLYDFHEMRKRGVLYIRTLQALGLTAIVLAAIFYAFPRMLLGRGVF